MSIDGESYDPAQLAAEEEKRLAEYGTAAKRLRAGAEILELVASEITEQIVDGDASPFRKVEIPLRLFMDIVGERSRPDEAASQITLGAQDVRAASDFQAGMARSARQTLDFLYGKLGDNSTADTDTA